MIERDGLPNSCYQCKHCIYEGGLTYYPYRRCGIANREITFGSDNGDQRMKWCPMLTGAERAIELVEKANYIINKIHPMFLFNNKREENPNLFVYYSSMMETVLKDMVEFINNHIPEDGG